MPIPFANWVITQSFLGAKLPSVLMMPGKKITERAVTPQIAKVKAAADRKIYTVPINVSYAMRMQSNLYLSKFAPPDANHCISYGHPQG
jgi:hypothetical protein